MELWVKLASQNSPTTKNSMSKVRMELRKPVMELPLKEPANQQKTTVLEAGVVKDKHHWDKWDCKIFCWLDPVLFKKML